MSATLPEIENPLTDGKIVGADMSYEDYSHQTVERGKPEYVMGRSDLLDFSRCPHKWLMGYQSEDTKATEWGQLFEQLVMYPDAAEKRFAVCPETYPDSKTGEPKPWTFAANFCKEWKAKNNGKTIVKAETWMQAQNAVKFFFGRPELAALVQCSKKQVMVEAKYQDKETGISVPIRALVDFAPDHGHEEYGGSLSDLKTTRSAEPFSWTRDVFSFGLHVQAAVYLDCWNSATDEGRMDFRHAISESGPPWETACRLLSQDFITLGRMRYIEALKRYCDCLKTGNWYGYDNANNGFCWRGWLITEPEAWMVNKP